jgi:hypothetical protein
MLEAKHKTLKKLLDNSKHWLPDLGCQLLKRRTLQGIWLHATLYEVAPFRLTGA